MRRLLRLFLLPVLACQPEGDAPMPGEHVITSVDPGLQLCGGSIGFMDKFVERLSREFFLLPPVDDERIHFHFLDSQEFSARSGCPASVVGCARGREVFSRKAPHNHELVHSVASVLGNPPAFFREGLAVAYEGLDEGSSGSGSVGYVDIREAFTASNAQLVEGDYYALAGAFTAFLINQYGMEAYLRLYEALDSDADGEEIERMFEEVFEAALDEAIEVFQAGPAVCSPQGYNAKLVECNAPPLPWDGQVLQVSRTLSCEDLDGVGPFGQGSVIVLHTIDVPKSGLYQLRVAGDHGAAVSLRSCKDACLSTTLVGEAGEAAQGGRLEAGRYTLRLHGPSAALTVVDLQLLHVGQ